MIPTMFPIKVSIDSIEYFKNKFLFKRNHSGILLVRTSILRLFFIYILRFWNWLRNFNYFPSTPPTTNQYKCRTQKISTYVFIVVLIVPSTVLILYISTTTVTKTFTSEEPNLEKYILLYKEYSSTLVCPCKTVAAEYQSFIRLNYALHQLCSNTLFLENWLWVISTIKLGEYYRIRDFRQHGSFVFRALKSLCNRANETIVNSLARFYTDQYVSVDLTPFDLFKLRSESFFNQFVSSTTSNFLSSLSIIREIIQINALHSLLHSGSMPRSKETDPYLSIDFMKYGNISCTERPSHFDEIALGISPYDTILFRIPGLYTGCYMLEALLRSNLQCFYDEWCSEAVISFFNTIDRYNDTMLDASIASRFSTTTPINNILENLMVENWTWSSDYESYFNTCRPIECTYIDITRNDFIYVVTLVISLMGGLVTILEFFVPRSVSLIRYIMKNRCTTMRTISNIEAMVNDHAREKKAKGRMNELKN